MRLAKLVPMETEVADEATGEIRTVVVEQYVYDEELGGVQQTPAGAEVPDPRPPNIPLGFRKPELLRDQVARLVRGHLSMIAEANGAETFEESEDFDVDDEFDPRTPYEEVFDPTLGRSLTPEEFKRQEHHYREQFLSKLKQRYRQGDLEEHIKEVEKEERRSRMQSGRKRRGSADPTDNPPAQSEPKLEGSK